MIMAVAGAVDVADKNQAVRPDAEMAIADPPGERGPVEAGFDAIVDDDEIVSGAMRLGESHRIPRTNRTRPGNARPPE